MPGLPRIVRSRHRSSCGIGASCMLRRSMRCTGGGTGARSLVGGAASSDPVMLHASSPFSVACRSSGAAIATER